MASNKFFDDTLLAYSSEAIPPGKIKCFVTGKLRRDTPEEKVRQLVARSLVEEYGYRKSDIGLEFRIKMGSAKKPVDIAIFCESCDHTQENIYLIAETKKEDVKASDKKEGVDQLGSYVAACPNTKFGLWVGDERLAFKVVEKSGRRITLQIPDIPRSGETTVPRPTRDNLVPAVNLKHVFKRIHNYIYANQGLQKDKAFEELLKLIFIKVFDEQYSLTTLQFYLLPGEDINQARTRLMAVFQKVQNVYKYIFKGNETIDLNDTTLAYVISELQRFSFVDTATDVKGEAYEELVGPNLRGDRGEFFTPRTVCNMVMEMLFSLVPEERLTSPGELKILDPAIGTGGFLISGIQKIKQVFSTRGFKYDQLRDVVRDVANSNFFGIDFNPFLVKVAQMNMVMHGDGSSNIVHANSLEASQFWNDEARKKISFSEFDIVVTNPPFGTKLPINNPEILKQYELTTFYPEAEGNTNPSEEKVPSPRNSLPPEQLFIERCLDFLKPGGILGIVLPDSILSNPGLVWIREWILKKAYVLASIDLPVETFEPHTGTQTSVLILRKKTEEQAQLQEDYSIFMAIPEKVGHDRRGNVVFKTTPEGAVELDTGGQPIVDDQLPLVATTFVEWARQKGIT